MLRSHHNHILTARNGRWSATDLAEAVQTYPGLRLAGNSLVGLLEAKAIMVKGCPVFFPNDSDYERCDKASSVFLEFEIQIGINASTKRPEFRLPGSRYEQTAERLGWLLSDLHIYGDRRTCYCAPQVFEHLHESNISALEFINQFVLPFLYWQGYLEKHRKLPWPDLAHGALGALEWIGAKQTLTNEDLRRTESTLFNSNQLSLLFALMTKRPRWYHRCPCGKSRKFGDCHPKALLGILALRSAASQGKLQRIPEFVRKVKQNLEKEKRQRLEKLAESRVTRQRTPVDAD